MPAYRVSSGDFELTLVRLTMTEAATDAIGMLRDGGDFDKVKLGRMTIVTVVSVLHGGEEEEPVFFPTVYLLKQHGLVYLDGEVHAYREN